MVPKRPKKDFDNISEKYFCDYTEKVIKKAIKCKTDELEELVRHRLVVDQKEIEDRKLTFSAVCLENTDLRDGNNFLKNQLEDCFSLIDERDTHIQEMIDEKYKLNEQLLKNKSEIEELNRNQEIIRNHRDELLLTKTHAKTKVTELEAERYKISNLENSFIVASYLMENLLLDETEKNLSLEWSVAEKGNLLENEELSRNNLIKKVRDMENNLEEKDLVIKNLEEKVSAQNQEYMVIEKENTKNILEQKEDLADQLNKKKTFISNLQSKINSKKVFIRNLQEEKGKFMRKSEANQKIIDSQRKIIYHLQTKTYTKNEVAMTEALSSKNHYCKFCAHQYVDDHDLQVHLLDCLLKYPQ